MGLNIVILAAGQGTRMKSSLPKILHPLAGKPLLQHVVDTALTLNPNKVIVVCGHEAMQVQQAMTGYDLVWVEQVEQLGTGHAVQQVLPELNSDDQVLILYGDVPLTQQQTLLQFTDIVAQGQLGLMTAEVDDPTGLGRIVRDEEGLVSRIVEHKDANDEQRQITEINTGIYLADASHLKAWLPKLQNQNSQQEYYLTDILSMAVEQGVDVVTHQPDEEFEVLGVNNKVQLAELEREYQLLQVEQLLLDGATIADPMRFDLRGTLKVGADVVIDVNAVIEGDVVLGDRCVVEAHVILRDVTVGDDVVIKANSIIEKSTIANKCVVGPFARIRPETTLDAGAKVGNFVEIKKSAVGENSKVSHLSYIGDAEIGKEVNVGAGTITCNYDGVNKHKTKIGDYVFIGSNTKLIAPLEVGESAFVAAGSTVSKSVPANLLTIERSDQKSVEWQRPVKEEK